LLLLCQQLLLRAPTYPPLWRAPREGKEEEAVVEGVQEETRRLGVVAACLWGEYQACMPKGWMGRGRSGGKSGVGAKEGGKGGEAAREAGKGGLAARERRSYGWT
jgi:hypothetical protein